LIFVKQKKAITAIITVAISATLAYLITRSHYSTKLSAVLDVQEPSGVGQGTNARQQSPRQA
jgi:hypothetical protein